MCKAVSQQTAQVRGGGLSIEHSFAIQGIQRDKKAALWKCSWASGIRECEAVRWAWAVQILPMQSRDFSVTDKDKLDFPSCMQSATLLFCMLGPLRGHPLQHAQKQAADFAGMERQTRTGREREAYLMHDAQFVEDGFKASSEGVCSAVTLLSLEFFCVFTAFLSWFLVGTSG